MKSILMKNRRIILHALLAAFIILVAFLYAKSQVGAHTAAPDPFQKTFFLISALMIIGLAVSFWLLLVKKVIEIIFRGLAGKILFCLLHKFLKAFFACYFVCLKTRIAVILSFYSISHRGNISPVLF